MIALDNLPFASRRKPMSDAGLRGLHGKRAESHHTSSDAAGVKI